MNCDFGAAAVGGLLRNLHRATRSFCPPPDAVWFPWHGRDLGGLVRVIGHCDVAPWNIVARGGLPVALIDWETAGPVDPLVELAQLAWRARSAAWMIRHRRILETALAKGAS